MTRSRKSLPSNMRKIRKEFLDYQEDSLIIEMRPIPFLARSSLYVAALLVIALVVWASLAKVDRIVIAEGKLMPEGRPLVVQPLETGVIRTIHVSIGDTVKKGDALVTLDPTTIQADVNTLDDQAWGTRLEAMRLQAELNQEPFVPPADAPPSDVAIQQNIYARRAETFKSTRDSWERRISETQKRLETLDASRKFLKEQLGMMEELESMYDKLYTDGHSSKVELLNARNRRVSLEGDLARANNEMSELGEELARESAERDAFVSQWRNQALNEFNTTKAKLEELESSLSKAQWYGELVILRAPADGVVLGIANRSIGSVVNTAETLVTLVPSDGKLIAATEIPTRDIAYVRTGDLARIKLEALPFQKHGMLEGHVLTISEDALSEETAMGRKTRYQVRISIDSSQLRSLDKDFRLIPGMVVTAEIMVGKRRVINYFLYPILRTLDQTLREP